MSVFKFTTTADFVRVIQARNRPVAVGQSFALYDVLVATCTFHKVGPYIICNEMSLVSTVISFVKLYAVVAIIQIK